MNGRQKAETISIKTSQLTVHDIRLLTLCKLAIFMLLLGILAGHMMFCVNCCADVLRYTIPAIPGDLADEYSAYAYWRDTNLLDHFVTMPSTARKYFILHLTAGCMDGVLSIITVVSGMRTAIQKKNKSEC